jgi:hypothetical protein
LPAKLQENLIWILNNLFAHLSPGQTYAQESKPKAKIYIIHVLSNHMAMTCSESSKQTKPSHNLSHIIHILKTYMNADMYKDETSMEPAKHHIFYGCS